MDRLIFQRTPKQTVCLCFFSSLLLFFCVFFRANSLSMTSSIAFRRTQPLLAFKAHNLISMTTDDVNDLKYAVDIYKQMSNSTITSAMRVNYIKLIPPSVWSLHSTRFMTNCHLVIVGSKANSHLSCQHTILHDLFTCALWLHKERERERESAEQRDLNLIEVTIALAIYFLTKLSQDV